MVHETCFQKVRLISQSGLKLNLIGIDPQAAFEESSDEEEEDSDSDSEDAETGSATTKRSSAFTPSTNTTYQRPQVVASQPVVYGYNAVQQQQPNVQRVYL